MITDKTYWEEDERVVGRAIYHQPNESDTAQAISRLKTAKVNSVILQRLLKVWHVCSIEGLLNSEVIAEKFRVDGGDLALFFDFTDGGPVLTGTPVGLTSAVDRILARTLAPKYREAVDDFSSGRITQSRLLEVIGEECDCAQDEVFSLKEAIDRIGNGEDERRLKTGFKRLDKATRGLPSNRITILASRPGVGKSDFALAIALNELKTGKRVFLASLEMDYHEVVKRLKRNDDISLMGVKENLVMDCAGKQSVARIAGHVRHFMPDLVIVDYLQILDSGSSIDDLYSRTSQISNQLRAAAKGTSYSKPAAWLVLSQLSRSANSESKQPELSHLRDSGAIEQDADTVLFLHEPTKKQSDETDKRAVQLTIAKNRSGERGFIDYEFAPSKSSWRESVNNPSISGNSQSLKLARSQKPA